MERTPTAAADGEDVVGKVKASLVEYIIEYMKALAEAWAKCQAAPATIKAKQIISTGVDATKDAYTKCQPKVVEAYEIAKPNVIEAWEVSAAKASELYKQKMEFAVEKLNSSDRHGEHTIHFRQRRSGSN